MRRVYLASRYSRRVELAGYRTELERAGFVVTARWLNGTHQIASDGLPIGEEGEALIDGEADSPEATALRSRFAVEDVEDVMSADVLLAFTEPPRSSASRGGRHVELGMALGTNMRVLVVGPRENLFCWHPKVEWHPDWQHALDALVAEHRAAS